VSSDPVGGPLVLRHASKRSSGTWGRDDYDVIQDGRDIGRIFKPKVWTITGSIVKPSHGFATSLDEAKANLPRLGARGCHPEGASALRIELQGHRQRWMSFRCPNQMKRPRALGPCQPEHESRHCRGPS
jgi:hypothetical protein